MYLKLFGRALRHFLTRCVRRDRINAYERSVYSQNGEDGMLHELFGRIGAPHRFFVEFGVEDGLECNTARLARDFGWAGVLLEGSPEKFRALDANYRPFSKVRRVEAFITRENIVELFVAAGVPHEFDLLSIDIDGND